MSLNRICIMGRITRDLELRRTQEGTAVTSFTVAVDDDFKSKATGEKKTYFLDVVAWRHDAEFACQYLGKATGQTRTEISAATRKSSQIISISATARKIMSLDTMQHLKSTPK